MPAILEVEDNRGRALEARLGEEGDARVVILDGGPTFFVADVLDTASRGAALSLDFGAGVFLPAEWVGALADWASWEGPRS